jgi:hypothetical protein
MMWLAALVCGLAFLAVPVTGFPVHGNQTVLPVGSELNEDALDRPREVFRSEALGVASRIWSIWAMWPSVRRRSLGARRGRPE